MHIVAALEYPVDDSAAVCFIDLDKLDPDNETHAAYLAAIDLARKDKYMVFDCHNMIYYGNEEMKKAEVKPSMDDPLEVKESLTIWGGG